MLVAHDGQSGVSILTLVNSKIISCRVTTMICCASIESANDNLRVITRHKLIFEHPLFDPIIVYA